MDRAMSMCIDEFLERITCKMGNMVDILLGEQVLSALLCYTIGVEKDDVVHHFHEFHTTLPDKLSLVRKAHLERATTSYIPVRWSFDEWVKLEELYYDLIRDYLYKQLK